MTGDAHSPFPGLRSFEQQDALFFFGRDETIDEVINRMDETRAVALIGPSGSGKSSLIRAGVIPAIEAGALQAPSKVAIFSPGSEPLGFLGVALEVAGLPANDEMLRSSSFGIVQCAAAAGSGPLLIVVDQFEEIFRFRSYYKRADEADFFCALLAQAVLSELPIRLLITMRSDFVGELNRFPALSDVLSRGLLLIPRMSRAQLREAVERPVEQAGARMENPCVQRILNDVADDPDALPRLQHVLMRTWQFWSRDAQTRPLQVPDYEYTGTFSEALDRHAEEVLAQLTEPDRQLAARIFRSLTIEDGGRVYRRPAPVREIAAGAGVPVQSILAITSSFIENRLLVASASAAGSDTADVLLDITHETLIQHWKRLSKWIKEEADARDQYLQLSYSAAGPHSRLNGVVLHQALTLVEGLNEAWAARYQGRVSFHEVKRFVNESQGKALHERRRRWVTTAFLIALALLSVMVWFAHRTYIP